MNAILVCVGAGLGAALRFMAAETWDSKESPRGTLAVNLVGSLIIGACVGWSLNEPAMAALSIGFCGGLTTYSGFAVQTHRLGLVRGGSYAAITVVGCIGLAALGFWVAQAA